MAKQPGIRVVQTTVVDVIAPVEAELPTCVVGPLYEVFVKEDASETFDPLATANTTVAWPSLRIGTVVDLDGTRNGYIDSQRRTMATMVPTVYLVDGTTEILVSDSNLEAIDQTGIEIKQEARLGQDRGTFSYWPLTLNNSEVLYNPAGGLSDIEIGDRVAIGAVSSTVASVIDTLVTVTEDISTEALTPSRVAQDEGGSVDVSITPSATPGRILATITGSDFQTEAPGVVAGDVVVTAVPMTGLTTLQGTLDTGVSDIVGLTFGVNTTLGAVDNYIVKIVNYSTDVTYTTVDQTYFQNLTAIDTNAGTMSIDALVGGVSADYVEVTIMEAQLGYVESINAPTNDELVIVVPNTFSDALAFVDLYLTANSDDFYPEFDVRVSYRSLRKDLVNTGYTAQSVSDFLTTTGHAGVDYRDGLGYAIQVTTLAQPNNRDVTFVPVDIEPGGTTGLPENLDLTTGYTDALEAAESLDVYNMILLNRSASIDAALESHVTTMSTETENAWRRGFFVEDVPLGSTESSTGEIAAGRASGGIVAALTNGNVVLRDANVAFVTTAGVVAGTKVVVTSPSIFAGEHTALGSTTDNDLILSLSGAAAQWELTKEFTVAAEPVQIDTTAADTHVLSAGSGTIDADTFVHVQAGDYLEVTEGGTNYRLLVTAVNLAGDEITCTDEVPGSLDFGTGNLTNATNVSVIRTWGPSNLPAVEYYINPLTKAQQVTALVANQTRSDRRFTVTLDYAPTIEISNGVKGILDPSLSLAAIAAKRSGLRAFDETTNLVLGGGIEAATYAFAYFKKSQLNTLSDAGFCLIAQKTSTSEPYIRDHITSDTTSLVVQEEIVTSNGDWMSKTLTNTYVAGPGQQLPILTKRLIGIRTIQVDAILKAWVDEGRLIDYTIEAVVQNTLNKRELDVVLTLVMPVAEKEIEFTLQLTV